MAKFRLDSCDSSQKQLQAFINKAETLSTQFDLQMDLETHRQALKLAKAAINKYALLQLVSRPNIQHATRGKALRSQLDKVWKSVTSHNLQDLFAEEFKQKIQMIIGTVGDAVSSAGKPSKGDEGD